MKAKKKYPKAGAVVWLIVHEVEGLKYGGEWEHTRAAAERGVRNGSYGGFGGDCPALVVRAVIGPEPEPAIKKART